MDFILDGTPRVRDAGGHSFDFYCVPGTSFGIMDGTRARGRLHTSSCWSLEVIGGFGSLSDLFQHPPGPPDLDRAGLFLLFAGTQYVSQCWGYRKYGHTKKLRRLRGVFSTHLRSTAPFWRLLCPAPDGSFLGRLCSGLLIWTAPSLAARCGFPIFNTRGHFPRGRIPLVLLRAPEPDGFFFGPVYVTSRYVAWVEPP